MSRQETRRTLNVRLVAGTLIAMAVLGPAAYFWHAFQLSRTAEALLKRADSLQDEGRWEAAAGYLHRYLRFRPDDADARIRLAETFDRAARHRGGKDRALSLYYRALGVASAGKDRALRNRVAELLLELGRYSAAEGEARQVLERNDEDPRARRVLALALYGRYRSGGLAARTGDGASIGAEFEKALELNPGDIILSTRLARIYRDEVQLLSDGQLHPDELVPVGENGNGGLGAADRESKADEIIDEMVRSNPSNPAAYLVRCRYRTWYKLPGADADLRAALEHGARNKEVLISSADRAFRHARRKENSREQVRRWYAQAARYCERAIEIAPQYTPPYLLAGEVYRAQGDADRAIETWKRGLRVADEQSPQIIDLNMRLAEVLIGQRRLDQQDQLVEVGGKRKTRLDVLDDVIDKFGPGLSRAERLSHQRTSNLLRARWLVKTGEHLKAIPLLKQVLAGPQSTAPEVTLSVDAGMLLGRAYAAREKWDEAQEAFERAAMLQPQVAKLDLEAAEFWLAEDQPERAFSRSGDTQRAELWLTVARGQFQRQVAVPEKQRNWELFQKALELARAPIGGESIADEWRIDLLKASYVAVRGEEQGQRDQGVRDARELLRRTEQMYPNAVRVLRPLALAYERLESPIDTDRVLKKIKDLPEGSRAAALLAGAVGLRRGNLREAIDGYREAIDLGDQPVPTYEGLIRLLLETRQFDEASKYLSQARDRGLSSQTLRSFEVSVAVGKGQLDQAVEVARADVESHPEDPLAHLDYAQVLMAAGREKEAEAAFREAVRIGRHDIRTYRGLFTYCVQTKHPELARETLRGLAENVDLPEAELALVFAQSYEQLGDRERAEANYRKAQQLDPENVSLGMHLTNFLLRSNHAAEAEEVLRRIAQRSPQAWAVRHALAGILAARGGEEEWQEAQQLLEGPGSGHEPFEPDERLKALLLARRGGEENRSLARQILEELVADPKNGVDADRLLLARVYEDEGKKYEIEGQRHKAEARLQAARQQYAALVHRDNLNPSHLASYVGFLLRNNDSAEAGQWLDRLEELTPEHLGTMGLRARWLRSQKRTAEIEPEVERLAAKLLKKVADDNGQEAQLCLRVGDIYTALELHPAAERWYRRLATLVPESYEPLARSLARQGRTKEALGVCAEAGEFDNSAAPAMVAASILILGPGQLDKDDLELAEPILSEAIENHSDNLDLLFNLANLRIKEQRVEDAIGLYRQILQSRPKHLPALNNLATLLAEQPGKGHQALEWIDQAIGIAGEQPALLDTKGTILIHEGKAGEAVALLETAAASPSPDPRYHFHLAVAYHRLGEADKARSALQKANDADLRGQILTQTDERLLAELQTKLLQ